METTEGLDIQERLGLYQVFLKLYEHHRGLLDEILSLENSASRTLANVSLPYVQGLISGTQVSLVTNLLHGKSRIFYQPQGIWTIGRDSRQVLLSVPDRRLSRCHAAIRYTETSGFQLIDLNSSNGSYLNGEPIRGVAALKDGDRVRLGALSFAFFVCKVTQSLPPLSQETLAQIEQLSCSNRVSLPPVDQEVTIAITESERIINALEDTLMVQRQGLAEENQG